MSSNPLEQVGNLSVESGLPPELDSLVDGYVDMPDWLDAKAEEPGGVSTPFVDQDLVPRPTAAETSSVLMVCDEPSFDLLFPGVATGDFTEVERCLGYKTCSQVDLVSYLDTTGDSDCEMEVVCPRSKVSSQVDLLTCFDLTGDSDCKMDGGLVEVMDPMTEAKKEPVDAPDLPMTLTFGALNLSPSHPAEALDQAGLPSLHVLQPQKQQQQQQQQQQRPVCPPQLNGFDVDDDAVQHQQQQHQQQQQPELQLQRRQQPASKPAILRRRSTKSGAEQQSEKSYLAVCQKNRIFDSGAKAKYQMERQLERDAIVDNIVDYVKQCLDPERDRVHRFLMVMLVFGQLESGPFWRFFQDAVYFCDSRKQRVIAAPAEMFHIRQSAYVGLLWGKFKGNECFDYATLGDAIKSVKSKCRGEQYFVDPDFGSSIGKPKRLFQFGQVAFDEVRCYHRQRSSDVL